MLYHPLLESASCYDPSDTMHVFMWPRACVFPVFSFVFTVYALYSVRAPYCN